jgi:hypothetical protein
MGRKAQRKQGVPTPLPGSDLDRNLKANKGKKRSSARDDTKPFKAAKKPNSKPAGKVAGGGRRIERKVKKIDQVDDDDSDLDEALQQG